MQEIKILYFGIRATDIEEKVNGFLKEGWQLHSTNVISESQLVFVLIKNTPYHFTGDSWWKHLPLSNIQSSQVVLLNETSNSVASKEIPTKYPSDGAYLGPENNDE